MVKLFILAIGVLFIVQWAIWPMQVSGNSMEPSLRNGEIIWTSKLALSIAAAERGDIVICTHPDTGKKLVKRLIAVGGDHVVISGDNLSVNGIEAGLVENTDNLNWFVPEGQVFVLGDNAPFSEDSRVFGCIKYTAIIRKVLK